MRTTILKLLYCTILFVFINNESSAQTKKFLKEAERLRKEARLAKESGKLDDAFYYYYLYFKNKLPDYYLGSDDWKDPMILEWLKLSEEMDGDYQIADDNYVNSSQPAYLFQIGYDLVQKNKYHRAIWYFLLMKMPNGFAELTWLGYYNAAVLFSNFNPAGFIKEANDLFEFTRRSVPSYLTPPMQLAPPMQLFAKAQDFLKANKPIPVSMIEKKIFDDYILANKFETVSASHKRYLMEKNGNNGTTPTVTTSTNELGISESDFNQVVRITGEANRSIKNSNAMMESYNKKTEDGRFRTESPDNMNTVYMASREARDAIASLEKVNNILKRAITSDNSNKVNALINYNQEQIKTLSASLDKKKN